MFLDDLINTRIELSIFVKDSVNKVRTWNI